MGIMKTAELYDLDFAQWAEQSAELLRSGRFTEADIEHIAEEIEDLAKSKRWALHSHFMRQIEHLLKWEFQPERRGASWQRTIIVQRQSVKRLLRESPSFRPTIATVIAEAYDDAVKVVSKVIGRPRKDFPEVCPYTADQLLDEDFVP
jgi:Domain of unknown function DUF29